MPRTRTVLLGTCMVLCGCTSPKVAPRAVIAEAPAIAPTVAEPDLSPVAEPPGVAAVVRLRNVRETLESLQRSLKLPIGLEGLLRGHLKEEKLDFFKLDASVDLVAGLDGAASPQGHGVVAAISVPLVGLEEARAAIEGMGERLEPIAPGIYRGAFVRSPTGPSISDEEGEEDEPQEEPKRVHCDVAASVGEAPARLICGDDERSLDVLGPWLARGLPNSNLSTSDLWAEVRFRPIMQKFGPMFDTLAPVVGTEASEWLQQEAGIHEPALLSIPSDILQETVAFGNDLDRMVFEADLNPDIPSAFFAGQADFRSKTSWFTKVFTSPNDKAGPPPEMFWRLPRNCVSATYGNPADPDLFVPVLRTTRLAVSKLLDKTPLSVEARNSIEDYVSSLPMTNAVVVAASGQVEQKPAAKKPATAAQRTPAAAVAEVKKFVGTQAGWSVIGIDAPSAPYAASLGKTARLYRDLVAEARRDKDLRQELDKASWLPALRVTRNPAGYPLRTEALDITVPFDSKMVWEMPIAGGSTFGTPHPPGAAVKSSITLRVVVVPEGANRTWVAWSIDDRELRDKVKTVMSGSAQNTLASLEGLEPLRSSKLVSGGFVNYGQAVAQTLGSSSELTDLLPMDKVNKAIASLPNGLSTPVLVMNYGTAGDTPSNRLEVRVQKGTMDDLAALTSFLMLETAGLFGSDGP